MIDYFVLRSVPESASFRQYQRHRGRHRARHDGCVQDRAEVLGHIDKALFARIGLPDWLIAQFVGDYVKAAVRLIADDALRLSLRRRLLESNAVQVFYHGEAGVVRASVDALAWAMKRFRRLHSRRFWYRASNEVA